MKQMPNGFNMYYLVAMSMEGENGNDEIGCFKTASVETDDG